jgi:hypothetical protein
MTIIIARFSRQKEKVGSRKTIAFRPRKEIYDRLVSIQLEKGISLNVVLNNLIEREFKKDERF